ncbi:MAG: hypothetical protein H7318_16625 [Oligoflexus sp.]|nr:hypothetical protein [Oligoflexus sp.]
MRWRRVSGQAFFFGLGVAPHIWKAQVQLCVADFMVGFAVESDEKGLMFAIAEALKSFDRNPKIIGIVLAAISFYGGSGPGTGANEESECETQKKVREDFEAC